MTQGVDISYRINSGVKYTVSIPRAVQMLMYPGGGLSNRLILSQTSSYNASKMDFYQYRNTNDAAVAKTKNFRKNSSGSYYAMPVVTKDTYDWVYAEVHINDGRIYSSNGTQLFSNSKIQAVLIHEMLHGYGLKDLYNSSNRNSIMYGYVSGTATGLTSDANKVLNSKY
ncbi:hypothetical protein BW721_10505 [Jeotgalibaca sp. PTS2502]|uniref:hypothetical protein n=1 Tax=Jeotgalibaca sp. PTS2502 TaxID=1903686 RepID=UPI000973D7D3|nr:hypothetical protein [Jeotgalibaca sp. PTS2502]APZ50022.1 hypothetical protein BW721_10505 [Jeotgalibaca sp. PTS2502]